MCGGGGDKTPAPAPPAQPNAPSWESRYPNSLVPAVAAEEAGAVTGGDTSTTMGKSLGAGGNKPMKAAGKV